MVKTRIIKGTQVSSGICAEVEKYKKLVEESGIKPMLAIVRVGEKKNDISYEQGVVKICKKTGINVRRICLPEDISPQTMIKQIELLNQEQAVHGILIMRPLLNREVDEAARNTILSEKDVDGITDSSLAGVMTESKTAFAPCTAQACIKILDFMSIDVKGKKVTIVGNSLVVGKPLAMLLTNRFATVTLCHVYTEDVAAECRLADIIIVAAGSKNLIGKTHVKEGQIILDVGINADKNGKVCGDVDWKNVEGIVEMVTPVPGGVGAVTTAVLAEHVVLAAMKQQNLESDIG